MAFHKVVEISAAELKRRLEAGEDLLLIDVREPWEAEQYGSIDGALFIPMNDLPLQLEDLDTARETVIYCHLGQRSYIVAQYMMHNGFDHVASLAGGIEAWQHVSANGHLA